MRLKYLLFLFQKELLDLFLMNLKVVASIFFILTITLNFTMSSFFKQSDFNNSLYHSSFLNWFFSVIPIFVILCAGTVFIREAFYRERISRVLETLLATGVKIQEIWLAKSFAVFLSAYLIFIPASLFSIPVQFQLNRLSFFSFFDSLTLFNFLIVFPLFAFSLSSLFCLLELFFKNVSMISFFVVFFISYPVNFLRKVVQFDIKLSFWVICISAFVFLLAFTGSFLLKKEQIIKIS